MTSAGNDIGQHTATDEPDEVIVRFVRERGLVADGASTVFEKLTGGVSSDIWLVRSPGTTFCVKRALPRLKVATEWLAPVERNSNEAAWLRTIAAFMPDAVPAVLAEDAGAGVFAMQYLPVDEHPTWKSMLREGQVEPEFAADVGRRLGRIHAVTARNPTLSARFATDDIFHAIRLEPYLLATADKHAELAPRLRQLAAVTATTKRTLVHGDAVDRSSACRWDVADAEGSMHPDAAVSVHLRHAGTRADRGRTAP